MQKYFKDTYGKDTIYIPNGVAKAKPEKPNIVHNKYGLKYQDYILFVGRVVPEKGIQYLIEAFKLLKKQGKTGGNKLVLAGCSSDTDYYFWKLKKSANNEKDIIFTGFVEGTELAELYSNAYLYVQPSDLEGMPLSLLEAMSFGRACLVSDIPENLETVNNTGLIFKHSSVEDLAKQFDKLISDSELVQKLGKQSKQYCDLNYNWDTTCEKTLKLYESLLA